MVELAKEFRSRDIEVNFLIYVPLNFYREALDEVGIPVACLDKMNYANRVAAVRRHIRKGKFDAVYSTLPGANMAAILAGVIFRKWKLTVSEGSANPAILKFDRGRIYRWCYVFADRILANSFTNIDMLEKVVPFLPHKKTEVIYNYVNFDIFHPAAAFNYRSNDKLTILIAARHHSLKNLDGLIEAVKLLPSDVMEKLRIEWYGDDGDGAMEKGQEKISNSGMDAVFRFHPAVKDIERVMGEADAVGLFSFYEGLPNAVCEGMAMGKPVIASAVSDVPALIAEERLLCDPHDARSIADSLEYLLSLPKEELQRIGDANYHRALELFDKNRILDRYIDTLLP